jgi:hypothetical protein
LLKDINADPESAKAMADTFSAALLNGMANGVANRGPIRNSGNHDGAKKGWETRRNGGAAPHPKVGQEGTAESLGLPSAEDLPAAGELPSHITHDAALQRISAGLSKQDPVGRQVVFDTRIRDHLEAVEPARAEFLPLAERTIERPAEIWEDGMRHYYLARFSKRGGGDIGSMVVCVRIGEDKNRVVTFSPKNTRELKSLRKGRLLYAAY